MIVLSGIGSLEEIQYESPVGRGVQPKPLVGIGIQPGPSSGIRFVDNEEIGRGESMQEEARKKEWFEVKVGKEERVGKEVQIGEKIVDGVKEVEVVKEDRKKERIAKGDQTEGTM